MQAGFSKDNRSGFVVLAGSVGLALTVGLALGSRTWETYAVLSVGLVLLFGWIERRRIERPQQERRRSRPRTQLRVIEGGRQGGEYDLAQDDSTDDQKFVM